MHISQLDKFTHYMKHILNKIVQVFFLLGQPSFWNPAEPNWSYYWKQFVDKNNLQKFGFVQDNIMDQYCGSNKAIACTHPSINRIVYYRQKASENSGYTNNKELHTFVEVLAHENEHVKIWNEQWPSGYKADEDKDNDFYNDNWEASEEGKKNGFSNSVCDQYSKFPGCPNVQYYGWLDNYNNSAGFKYEEKRCIEEQKSVLVSKHDSQDFSFDILYKFQGKNWQ